MTIRDLLAVSTGNMWRMKFRAFLTIMGVVIAIAAFISMLSFGAGNQEYIENQFNKLGLFSTMQVYQKTNVNPSDTTTHAPLDNAAIEHLSTIRGVNLVYPYDAFTVSVKNGDSVVDSKAQALPYAAIQTKLFANLEKGRAFTNDSAKEAIISADLMKKLGFASPESAIGKSLIVSVKVSVIDSGLSHIIMDKGESLLDRAKRIHYDSLLHRNYRNAVLRAEANEILRRFVHGFMGAKESITDTLIICGVRESRPGNRLRIEPVIIPFSTAALFSSRGMGGSPMDMMSAFTSGTLFSQGDDGGKKTFSMVTIDFDPSVPYKSIKDSVEACGFRTFSFAAEFEEIQKAFFYFDLGLGVVGLIALITASLGIINTMVMSVNERKREIGILKSLGADESDIRYLFLVESGIIGVIGTSAGIFIGWGITRIVSAIAQSYMQREGIPAMELFSLPLWLIGIALAIGIGVSVLAGFYPAARASRVDPVAALRNE